MKTDLAGKNVLVTGASGGIGNATARAFAAEGARVALHYFRNREGAEALAEEIEADGGEAFPCGADLRQESDTDELFASVLERFGRLDTLVVNAGIWIERHTPLHEMELAQWHRTMDADLTSAFLCCRAFLRHLAAEPRESASIVMVGSTAALFGEEGHADYSAAKAALTHGLTLSLKNEIARLAPCGRVNTVCPGWVVTPMTADSLDPDEIARVTATRPVRKIGKPEDIAAAIVFLASDRLAGHLSGTRLPVAGGMEGRLLHEV